MSIKKVALIGANGTLGPAVLQALLNLSAFEVSVISRKGSKSTYPSSVSILETSADPSDEELATILHGQDALIVTFSGNLSEYQIRLANAAAKAGVKHFIPADFGSCDSSSPRALELLPLYGNKKQVREHLQKLVAEGSELSWTSIVSGHFFGFGVKSTFDITKKKARIFDGGDIKFSTTTKETIGRAAVEVLRTQATKNRMLYIQSFAITQNEVLASLKRATGDDWIVENVKSEEYITVTKKEIDQHPDGNAQATEDLVSVLGIVDAYWEEKEDFANQLLGLQVEDLDAEIEKLVAAAKKT